MRRPGKKAAKAAFARVAELNRILSDYLPDSELMQLCKQAGGDPVKVSDDLFAVLRKSEEIAKLSDALRCEHRTRRPLVARTGARRSNSRTWTHSSSCSPVSTSARSGSTPAAPCSS